MVPWNQLNQVTAFGATGPPLCVKGDRRSQWGVGVQSLDVATYVGIAEMYQQMITEYPASIGSVVDMQLLPTQGVLAIPDKATAYPWRSLISHMLVSSLSTILFYFSSMLRYQFSYPATSKLATPTIQPTTTQLDTRAKCVTL
jgi:hypothetical protein